MLCFLKNRIFADFFKIELMQVTRLFDMLERDLQEFPKEDALCCKENGIWVKYSTAKYVEIVNNLSYGLLQLGIKKGDSVATITPNRPEWNFLDMAIMQIGALHVAIYPTISESDYRYIFNDANVKMVFVAGWDLLRKITQILDDKPELKDKVYTFRNLRGYKHLNEVIELGRANPTEKYLNEIKESIKPDDVVSLVYTSGTTGFPKGVMLSHRNFLSNVEAILPIIPTAENNRILSYLPLCHVYERMMNYSWQYLGLPIYYAESLAKIQENMVELKPDIFTTVPRLLEKVYDKILAKGHKLSKTKQKIFFWANEIALQYGDNPGKRYDRRLKLARKLVLNQWNKALGGNLKVIARVRIADDGEILTKGPHVMKGYYNQPEQTAEVIDTDGWLHTGDLGELTPEGRLKITGRKKEMFKTAFGKYVVPTIIENKFLEESLIDNILVVGENKQFAAALIVPNFTDLRSWCLNKEIPYTTNEEMIQHPEVQKKFKKIVDEYNAFFGDTEKVKRFLLMNHEWSIQSGELTPTLKLKRNVLIKKYEEQIEKLFA